jgi:glycosyltransferase involved in cell wall biosynthesis
MACVKPIIAALEGEPARVISESGAGLICPPEDGPALARIILQMYRMTHEERTKIGDHGRIYAETKFGRQLLLDRLEGWMVQLAGETRCAF